MSRKRATPPPRAGARQVDDARYLAFWQGAAPAEPTVCRHSESERFPWLLRCGLGCGARCRALDKEQA